MRACAGAEQLLNELIKKGADVKVAAAGGVTALHVAAEGGDVGIVQSLLKVLPLADPYVITRSFSLQLPGTTALSYQACS